MMLAVLGVASIAGGACIACGTTQTRFEARSDIFSGLLVIFGLSMIGAMLPL